MDCIEKELIAGRKQMIPKVAVIFFLILLVCGGCSGSDSGDGQGNADILFSLNFNDHALGPYTKNHLCQDWNCPSWDNGVSQGRLSIVDDGGNRALRISYPKGEFGPEGSGAQWQFAIPPHDELYFSYRLKFGDQFDFVRGGKLPGFAGGSANTGGNTPDGYDGWSARMMWKEGGRVIQYVYYPDQNQNLPYGDAFTWTSSGRAYHFTPGVWYQVEVRVVMNQPGEKNGLIQSWLNGVKALDKGNLRFRDTANLAIDMVYFSTFFGGDDRSWAPFKDENIYFDDFIISTHAITH